MPVFLCAFFDVNRVVPRRNIHTSDAVLLQGSSAAPSQVTGAHDGGRQEAAEAEPEQAIPAEPEECPTAEIFHDDFLSI